MYYAYYEAYQFLPVVAGVVCMLLLMRLRLNGNAIEIVHECRGRTGAADDSMRAERQACTGMHRCDAGTELEFLRHVYYSPDGTLQWMGYCSSTGNARVLIAAERDREELIISGALGKRRMHGENCVIDMSQVRSQKIMAAGTVIVCDASEPARALSMCRPHYAALLLSRMQGTVRFEEVHARGGRYAF